MAKAQKKVHLRLNPGRPDDYQSPVNTDKKSVTRLRAMEEHEARQEEKRLQKQDDDWWGDE